MDAGARSVCELALALADFLVGEDVYHVERLEDAFA